MVAQPRPVLWSAPHALCCHPPPRMLTHTGAHASRRHCNQLTCCRNLLKLADTRSTDGKESLLSWIARQLAAASPPAPVLAEEAPAVASPRLRVAVDEAAGALEALAAGLAAVAAELERTADGGSDGDGGGSSSAAAGASASLHAVAAELEAQLAAAQALLQRCREGFSQLAAFYGESAAALPSEQEFWLQVQAFVERFSAAQRAVAAERKAEEERLRRQASGSAPGSTPRRPSRGPPPSVEKECGAASQQPAPSNGAAAPAGTSKADAQQPAAAGGLSSPVSEPPPRPPSRQLSFPSPRQAEEPAGAEPAAGEAAVKGNGAADNRVQQLLQQADVSSEDET